MFKIIISSAAFFITLLLPLNLLAAASGKLTSVVVKRTPSGVAIDLTFDRQLYAKSLKPSFERNFVQFVLKSTKLDSARIQPVSDSTVQKVFTYPYSIDTSRVRVILKRDSQWAKGRLTLWNNNPKSVRLFIKDPQQAQVSDVNSRVVSPSEAALAVAVTQTAPAESAAEEKKLIKEVMSKTRDIDINDPDSVKAALARPAVSAVEKNVDKPALKSTDTSMNTGDTGATGAFANPPARAFGAGAGDEKTGPVGIKADPSRHFTRMAAALFGVLALFIGGIFLVKRYASKIKRLPFGKKERLIDVVATHYLGNKKSISLVKVTGEYMVVGVSNDGISLISKLGPEVSVDKYLEDRFWGGTFEKHLDHYAKDPKVTKDVDLALDGPSPNNKKFLYDGVKDMGGLDEAPAEMVASKISDKVELSPLRASIKQKLTKLKPLA